jgi:DNA replication protein DnaC
MTFIVLDKVDYAPFAQVEAELLFQVIPERAERAITILTNLPFSE